MHNSQAGKKPQLHPHPAHLTLCATPMCPGKPSSPLRALVFLCKVRSLLSYTHELTLFQLFLTCQLLGVPSWESIAHCQRLCPSSEQLCANTMASTYLLLHSTHRYTSGILRYWLHTIILIKQLQIKKKKIFLKIFFSWSDSNTAEIRTFSFDLPKTCQESLQLFFLCYNGVNPPTKEERMVWSCFLT